MRQFRYHDSTHHMVIFKCCTDRGTLTVQPDGRVIHIENGTMQTICSYEWDDVDAGVLCRYLGINFAISLGNIHSICN
jgi:hypothetical protein